jgi:23S rRNA (pseudouridine1915-N3)-methyltransferase
LKIVVLVVGKMRDRHVGALCDDYLARVRRHLPLEVVEVEDDAGLRRRLPADGDVIALEPGGVAWTTERFARHVEEKMTYGARTLTFLVGGADGLPADVVARAQLRLSLSAMTLPHRLARLVLCEQIYRAVAIIRNEPYHH